MTLKRGDRVHIERDENRWPSEGTWPQFRGRTGTIVDVNLGEYGIAFGNVSRRTDGRGSFNWTDASLTWFQPHELRRIGTAL